MMIIMQEEHMVNISSPNVLTTLLLCNVMSYNNYYAGRDSLHYSYVMLCHAITIMQEETVSVKRTLMLGYNRPDEGFVPDKSCGQITVSVVFRPIASVAKSGQRTCYSLTVVFVLF
jgi:hypothetical protein